MTEPSPRLGNYALVVSYDGRRFFGWQRHGSQPTVQGALEAAIAGSCGVEARVCGSGRTDRGAHARAQVANVRLPVDIDPERFSQSLDDLLPPEIRVQKIVRVGQDFHARDSAIAKIYRYVIWNDPQLPPAEAGRVWHVPGALQLEAMREACPVLVGEHDFASFATRPNFEQASTRRTVTRASLWRDGPRMTFEIQADGFLYKMVRNIVRAVVKVGEGRHTPAHFAQILAAGDRKAAPGTAPASGLYLHRVIYPGSLDESLRLPDTCAPAG